VQCQLPPQGPGRPGAGQHPGADGGEGALDPEPCKQGQARGDGGGPDPKAQGHEGRGRRV